MKGSVHICCFDSTLHLRGRKRTYEAIKAAVLEAGRFSVFEATVNQKTALMFDQLTRDPELEFEKVGFPWTKVMKKQNANPT